MASKKRGGLSRREYAAKQKGGTLNYKTGGISVAKKPATKSSLSSSQRSTLTSIANSPFGSLLGSTVQGMFKTAPVQGPLTSSGQFYSKESPDSPKNKSVKAERQKAAAAYTPKSSLLPGGIFGTPTASANGGSAANLPGAVIRPSSQSSTNSLWRSILNKGLDVAKYTTPFGGVATGLNKFGYDVTNLLGIPKEETSVNDYWTEAGNEYKNQRAAENINELFGRDVINIPSDFNETVQPQPTPQPRPTDNWRRGQEEASRNARDNYNRPKPQPTDYSPMPDNWNTPDYWQGVEQNQNTDISNVPDPTPVQQDNGTVPRPYGSGAWGTGKGVSTAGLDPATAQYIKELRRSASGDFGTGNAKDWLKSQTMGIDDQIKNLIQALNPQYAEYQRQSESEINKAKTDDLNKLMSLFAAYGTSDSEQRMQTQERTQNDYQNRLADLLAKLNTQKQADISGYQQKGLGMKQDVNTKYFDIINQINEQKRSAQSNVANLIYKAQQDAYDRAVKRATAGKPKYNSTEFWKSANSMKTAGKSWGDIAHQLGANYDLTPGSDYSSQLDAIMTGNAPKATSKFMNLGNGKVLDTTTGDVFEI